MISRVIRHSPTGYKQLALKGNQPINLPFSGP